MLGNARPVYIAVALGVNTAAIASAVQAREPVVTRLRTERAAVEAVVFAPATTTTTTTVPPTTTTTTKPAARAVAPRAARSTNAVSARSPGSVGQEALRLITYPWQQRLNVSIAFAGPRPGYRATSTDFGHRAEIVVYVRPTDTARLVAVNIAHELGHLVDYNLLTDNDRSQWLSARGRPEVRWWACNYCEDYSTGSGDFAEVFAAWQVGAIDYRSRVAPPPTPAEMSGLVRFFK